MQRMRTSRANWHNARAHVEERQAEITNHLGEHVIQDDQHSAPALFHCLVDCDLVLGLVRLDRSRRSLSKANHQTQIKSARSKISARFARCTRAGRACAAAASRTNRGHSQLCRSRFARCEDGRFGTTLTKPIAPQRVCSRGVSGSTNSSKSEGNQTKFVSRLDRRRCASECADIKHAELKHVLPVAQRIIRSATIAGWGLLERSRRIRRRWRRRTACD